MDKDIKDKLVGDFKTFMEKYEGFKKLKGELKGKVKDPDAVAASIR